MKKEEKKAWKYWLNEWESYVGTVLFTIILILLTGQVLTRYVFNLSFSWLEELATVLYVAMIYCAIASATTHRKHIVVDALTSVVPFQVKKALLILADLIFLVFCCWIVYAYVFGVMKLLGNAITPMLKIPKKLVYGTIPFFIGLTGIRTIQDIFRLAKETEKQLGASKPSIDVDALEKEYLDRVTAETKRKEGWAQK